MFQTRSLFIAENDSLFHFPVLSYLRGSLGTAWLSKDALLLEQSPTLSKGQAHKSGTCSWKRVEWPWTLAPTKAKCSNRSFGLGFARWHLLKDVNLWPLLELSHVKTEVEQKSQSRAAAGWEEKMGMKPVCAFWLLEDLSLWVLEQFFQCHAGCLCSV